MGSFETSEQHSNRNHQPIRVPRTKEDIFGAAREMCDDMESWTVVTVDEEGLVITCERSGGLLGGTSKIFVSVAGPDGMPTSTTSVKSESSGGLFPKDKANVAEFVKKFTMRVC